MTFLEAISIWLLLAICTAFGWAIGYRMGQDNADDDPNMMPPYV
jgi:hypothetical protein